MGTELNHTIVCARDKEASASFLAGILDRGDPVPFGPFMGVELDNAVTLDFVDVEGENAAALRLLGTSPANGPLHDAVGAGGREPAETELAMALKGRKRGPSLILAAFSQLLRERTGQVFRMEP